MEPSDLDSCLGFGIWFSSGRSVAYAPFSQHRLYRTSIGILGIEVEPPESIEIRRSLKRGIRLEKANPIMLPE